MYEEDIIQSLFNSKSMLEAKQFNFKRKDTAFQEKK